MKNKIFVGSLFVLLLSFSSLASAGNFQPRKPFDAAEFNRFMADYPQLSQWLATKSLHQGTESNPWVMSGMRYNRAFVKQLQDKGWDADRFFYLLDHINMGLLTSQAEAKRDAAREILTQQRKKMQSRMAAGQKKLQEQMREQMRSSTETAQKQWAAQRERITNNPYIPPEQKQRILAQMDRSKPTPEQSFAEPPSFEQWHARMREQQQRWIAEQKRQIKANPAIPPQQKQAMLAQMDRSMTPMAPPQQQKPFNPAEERAKRQAQQKQQIEAEILKVRDNPSIHPMHKKQILNNLQRSLTQLEAFSKQPQERGGLIPNQENDLIKNNRLKLMKLFFPER